MFHRGGRPVRTVLALAAAVPALVVLGLALPAGAADKPPPPPPPSPSVTVTLPANIDNATPNASDVNPPVSGSVEIANTATGARTLRDTDVTLTFTAPAAVDDLRVEFYTSGGAPLRTQPAVPGGGGTFSAVIPITRLLAGADVSYGLGIAVDDPAATGPLTVTAAVAGGTGHATSTLLTGQPSLSLQLDPSLTPVSSLANEKQLASNGLLTVANNGAGAASLDHVVLGYSINGPSGLEPDQIAFRVYCPSDQENNAATCDQTFFPFRWIPQPVLGGGDGNLHGTLLLCCNGPGPLPLGYDEAFPITVAVSSSAPPGELTMSVGLLQNDAHNKPDPGNPTVRATASAQTGVVSSPGLAGSPPHPTVRHAYSFTLATPGVPAAATWKVYRNDPSGPTPVTAGGAHDTVYALNDGLQFDTSTGVVSAPASALTTADAKPRTYTIVANNGTGGATTADPTASPPVALHDVSVTVAFPVLFADLPTSAAFADSIYALASEGIIGGYPDGTFRSSTPVSREAFAHFLAVFLKLAGQNVPLGACSGPGPYPDVSKGLMFCSEISYLSAHGIVNGYTDGRFRPAANISRQAMAALLYRVDRILAGVAPKQVTDAPCPATLPFPDVSRSNMFCGDIAWMRARNISNGYTDGYHPSAPTSRAATAAFIVSFQRVENKP